MPHYLSLDLGKSLSEVEELTAEELIRWIAWYGVHPPGRIADDLRTASLAQTSANGAAFEAEIKNKRKALPFSRFYRDPWIIEKRDIVAQMKDIARRLRRR